MAVGERKENGLIAKVSFLGVPLMEALIPKDYGPEGEQRLEDTGRFRFAKPATG
jgi:hypothetical protein